MDPIADDERPQISAPVLAYHRDVLVAHANDLVTQVCAACQVSGCPHWRNTRDRPLAGDEPTAPHQSMAAAPDRRPRS